MAHEVDGLPHWDIGIGWHVCREWPHRRRHKWGSTDWTLSGSHRRKSSVSIPVLWLAMLVQWSIDLSLTSYICICIYGQLTVLPLGWTCFWHRWNMRQSLSMSPKYPSRSHWKLELGTNPSMFSIPSGKPIEAETSKVKANWWISVAKHNILQLYISKLFLLNLSLWLLFWSVVCMLLTLLFVLLLLISLVEPKVSEGSICWLFLRELQYHIYEWVSLVVLSYLCRVGWILTDLFRSFLEISTEFWPLASEGLQFGWLIECWL